MESKFFKYFSVLGATMLKFILGPTVGFASGLSYWETVIFTFLGMMLAVSLVIVLGVPFRNYLQQKFASNSKKFTPRKRMTVKVWKKYGIIGIAFLTPLILTPIGGSIIAVSFGEKKQKIIVAMAISAMAWAVILCAAIYFAGDWIKTITQ